jgi:hypothetical protein
LPYKVADIREGLAGYPCFFARPSDTSVDQSQETFRVEKDFAAAGKESFPPLWVAAGAKKPEKAPVIQYIPVPAREGQAMQFLVLSVRTSRFYLSSILRVNAKA